MIKANHPKADLAVIVADDGHILLFQGYYKQALFIHREHVPRFLENPKQAAMLVIPPFAANALECYTVMKTDHSIALKRDLAISPEFRLIITMSGAKIAYYSDHEAREGACILHTQGISIVITPKEAAAVSINPSGASPSFSPIACVPKPEVPNYPRRFALDPALIKGAVRETLHALNPTLRYAN